MPSANVLCESLLYAQAITIIDFWAPETGLPVEVPVTTLVKRTNEIETAALCSLMQRAGEATS